MNQAIVLAGGMGTRLRARLGDLPKPMIPIAGKPLLEHLISLAASHGFSDIVLFSHYRADLIKEHFGDGRKWNVRLRHVVEDLPRGTAGAVLSGLDYLNERFLVLYGDTMVNVDLRRLWRAHETRGADATLLLHPNDHPEDSDLVETGPDSSVIAFHNRPHPPGRWLQNLVNAGLYVLEKSALAGSRLAPEADRGSALLDFGKDLFPAMLEAGRVLYGYNSPEYIKDIGTPDRYDRVCAEYASGVIERSTLTTPQPTVFIDRDGTLIREVGPHGLASADLVELLAGVGAAIRRLNHAGWRAVVITNQPVIAKGMCSESELKTIHNKMETLLGREHAFVDRIYWCPHHPERGFEGERPELKIQCSCRKPAIGMIESAAADLNVDLSRSWVVGDSTTDLQTAANAGLRSILVKTGHRGEDGKYPVRPHATCENLSEAVDLILGSQSQADHRKGGR